VIRRQFLHILDIWWVHSYTRKTLLAECTELWRLRRTEQTPFMFGQYNITKTDKFNNNSEFISICGVLNDAVGHVGHNWKIREKNLVTNYQSTLRKPQEERRFHFHNGGKLQPRIENTSLTQYKEKGWYYIGELSLFIVKIIRVIQIKAPYTLKGPIHTKGPIQTKGHHTP
jgi:hypothetical protein